MPSSAPTSARRCGCRAPAASRTARIRRPPSRRSGRADSRIAGPRSFPRGRGRSNAAVRVRRCRRSSRPSRGRSSSSRGICTSCVNTISPLPSTPQRSRWRIGRGDAAHRDASAFVPVRMRRAVDGLTRTFVTRERGVGQVPRLPFRQHAARRAVRVARRRCRSARATATARGAAASSGRPPNASCVSSPVAASNLQRQVGRGDVDVRPRVRDHRRRLPLRRAVRGVAPRPSANSSKPT